MNVRVVGVTRHGESESTQLQQDLPTDMILSDVATYFENIRLKIFVDEAQNTPCFRVHKSGVELLA